MSSLSYKIKERKLDDANEYRRNAPDVLDATGAAKYLGVSERYLSENARELDIPFREIGRQRLFSRRALIEWVERNVK